MLQLSTALATLTNLNVRTEKVGREKTRPAADLKFSVDLPNTQLDEIHPGLLNSLYRHPDEQGHQADLTAPDPSALTTPRYPRAKPWASTEDWPGYFAEIHAGEFKVQDVELDKVKLKGITVEAKNGGTITVTFTLSGYPDGAQVGVLYELMGAEVDLTITPPSLGDLEKLRAADKAPKRDADDAGDEGDDDAPPTDAQAGRAFPDAIDARGPRGVH